MFVKACDEGVLTETPFYGIHAGSMKVVRSVMALWMCLIFVSSGLQGLVFCVAADGHACLKFEEGRRCGKPCAQSHEDHQERGVSRQADERCCRKCVDIPVSGARIPEFTVRQAKVIEISRALATSCLNTVILSYSSEPVAAAVGSFRLVPRPAGTVVLRI